MSTPELTAPREDVVRALVDGAMDGMLISGQAIPGGYTPREAFSAMMTVALRALGTAERMGVPLELFRESLAQLNAKLPRVN